MEAQPRYRYRLTFGKEKPVKYVAHLDGVLTWTRAFRRAGVPLAYTQGFSPQARIQVAASLPVGSMGRAEKMDIWLTEPMPPEEILSRVNATLPAGFNLSDVESAELKEPALQARLRQAEYEVMVETNLPADELEESIDELLASETVMQTRTRRKKIESFDLRPLLHSLSLLSCQNDEATLAMRLSAGQEGNLRPEAVLAALALSDAWFQVERTSLFFEPLHLTVTA